VVSFTPWPLCPPGKEPPYPLKRRLCGAHSLSGVFRKGVEPRAGRLLVYIATAVIASVNDRLNTAEERNSTLARLGVWRKNKNTDFGM